MEAAVMRIDLDQVRGNAMAIKKRTGAALFATLKADAYHLGAPAIAQALNKIADAYCVFTLEEAVALRSYVPLEIPIRTMGPAIPSARSLYTSNNVIACITREDEARALKGASTYVCVDTGFGRLAAPLSKLAKLLELSGSREVMTMLVSDDALEPFERATRGLFRHAAASAQLDDPRTYFDAVRPGIALYDGAVKLTCKVFDVSRPGHASGYSQFSAERFGVIGIGYAEGLRPGPCLVDGAPSTVLEVGMQTACVALRAGDGVGATVTLLGDEISPTTLGKHWGCRPHEVLTSLGAIAQKEYVRAE